MTLNEFINKRCAELGITKTQLCERGNLVWSTLTMIAKGKTIKTVTKEKLARGLQCTIGDINKCLAEEPNPLRKEAATREGTAGKQYEPKGVMETVDKLEKMVSEKPYVTPEPEEVYELTEEEKELNGVKSFEELQKKQHPEGDLHLYNVKRPAEEEIDVKPLLLETTAADYQSYLRGLILHQLVEAEPGTTVEQLWIWIGRMVAKEVL